MLEGSIHNVFGAFKIALEPLTQQVPNLQHLHQWKAYVCLLSATRRHCYPDLP